MLNEYTIYITSIAILTILSAFFSGMETAIVSASRLRIEHLAKIGKAGAKRGLSILDNIDDFMSMVLVGNNLVNISAASFITYVVTKAFTLNEFNLLMVTLIQTVVFLITCEVTPKIFSRAHAERFLMLFSPLILIFMFILKPTVFLASKITKYFKKRLHVSDDKSSLVNSRDEIDIFFQIGENEGVIDEDHQSLISEVLSIRDISAHEVMTPTIDIVSLNIKSSIKELVSLIVSTHFSRIPIYDERVDNIVGYVFYRDIIRKPDAKSVGDLLHPPFYIPATKNIYDLYVDMKDKNELTVFVVNEFGAVIGMVTHEDIAEEVVGEINTSDHEGDILIEQINKRKYIVAGDTDIEYFMKKFDIEIEKHGFETVAGFLMYLMGKIPKVGEKIQYGAFSLVIEEATERSIERVQLLLPK